MMLNHTFEYPATKRNEITFGYLPSVIPHDLVPDLKGSVKQYDAETMWSLMLSMDEGFVGIRRNVIDKTQLSRQVINYQMLTRQVEGVTQYAVYIRANGADARLEGKLSIGFGGHIDADDIAATETCGSFDATIVSGHRELIEEVSLSANGTRVWLDQTTASLPLGFISDLKLEDPNWVGNTHLGVFSIVTLPDRVTDFEMLEKKYSVYGWCTLEELRGLADRLENWSKLLVQSGVPALT